MCWNPCVATSCGRWKKKLSSSCRRWPLVGFLSAPRVRYPLTNTSNHRKKMFSVGGYFITWLPSSLSYKSTLDTGADGQSTRVVLIFATRAEFLSLPTKQFKSLKVLNYTLNSVCFSQEGRKWNKHKMVSALFLLFLLIIVYWLVN